MIVPVRPLPALQCTTATFSLSAASHVAIDWQTWNVCMA